ncbi:Cytochrome P450 superfamily [Arabidopsis suecica]|uniref:Cytochrome P450 superfamily n=1 Tax=Arabidopsis suecica TaxID=45249 RepID=A0A8T2F703_ARASU|nr:Cytochrome P450 superfamily [Arabidopsis suecica]
MKKLLVTNLLGPQALERSRGFRADELDLFYENLLDKAMKKESVDICVEALKLSNNSICKMIMGRSCSEENGEAERVRALATQLDGLTKKILLANMLRAGFKKLVVSLFRKEMMDVSSRFDELLERILVEHEDKLDMHHQGTDLVDALLAACRDKNAEYKISRNHIKSFFADLLFASTDTFVQTTQWTVAEIINNPNVLERLRGEIDSVVGKARLIQETDLPNLPYLQAVVKEGLRLHPPGPLFARFSQEGCRIGGFYVPEKTTLMINACAVMRDSDSWEDPDEFKPERFLASSRSEQEKERREQAIKYIAFGSGRRSCPGENLAYIFLGTAIGVMVQGFEWRIKEEKVNMEEANVGLSLTMAYPLKVTPVPRTLVPLTQNPLNRNIKALYGDFCSNYSSFNALSSSDVCGFLAPWIYNVFLANSSNFFKPMLAYSSEQAPRHQRTLTTHKLQASLQYLHSTIISLGNQAQDKTPMTVICLQALLLCQSSAIFTLSSLLFPRLLCVSGLRYLQGARCKRLFSRSPSIRGVTLVRIFQLHQRSPPYGDYWKFMKKLMVTKLLGPHALERSRKIRADELYRLYTNLLDKAMKKESVEIGKETMKLTNNTICKMIMGRSCSEENGEAKIVRGLIAESFTLSKKFFLAATLRRLLEKLGISLFQKEIMGVSRGFDELLERILREHEEKPDEHHDTDMMDALLAAYNDEKAEYKITRNQIKAFIVDMFIAGTDISALTTQGTMAEIINNPNVLIRIREEIHSVVGKSRLIQETDLPKLPYLQAVVKEGLRLHPPTPLMVREFQEGCKVKGFYIPASTTLVVNGYAVMRDPNVWEDPEEFKPERFLASSRLREEEEIREQALKYIAFGSGRRGCPGTNIAYIFVGMAIGMMVQCFDWKIKGDKVDMKEAIGGLNLTLAHPLKCTPVARSLNPLISYL